MYIKIYIHFLQKRSLLYFQGYVEWQKIDSNNEIVVRNTELTDLAVLVTDKKKYIVLRKL